YRSALKRPTEGRSWENTLAFLAEASSVPLDKKPVKGKYPPRTSESTNGYDRKFEQLGKHAGLDKSLVAIASETGTTRQNISARNISTIKRLHEYASHDTREKFPLSS